MKKIKKLQNNLSLSLKIATSFGVLFGIRDFICSSILRGKGNIGKRAEFKRYEKIKNWIYLNYFKSLKNEYKGTGTEETETIKEDCPIWFFWWQGIENAPRLVNVCLASIEIHRGKHPINIITSDNVRDFAEIPEYIYEKLEKGIITLTHFSDILRAQLLFQHGGIWMDSTMLMVDEFSQEIYKKSFYTIHHEQRANYHVCKGKWSGFFLASVPGNPIFKYLSSAFYEFWNTQECLIGYLLIDCFIALGYENIPEMKKQVDSVPINNIGTLNMAMHFNDLYTKEIFEDLCSNTYLHKLSNKCNINENDENLYNYIINKFALK